MGQINIQGIIYRIRVENNLIRDSGAQAEINFVDRIIRIDSEIYGTDRGNIALLHEVIHGILEGLCFEEENENEHLIQCLAVSLYQIFREDIEKCIGQKQKES